MPQGQCGWTLACANAKQCNPVNRFSLLRQTGESDSAWHVQWAFPFNEPVELDRYPDYLKAVSEPMDFGTVKAKIDSGAYTHPGQFNTDMRLVFGNAHKYNPPGSDVNHMATTILVRQRKLTPRPACDLEVSFFFL